MLVTQYLPRVLCRALHMLSGSVGRRRIDISGVQAASMGPSTVLCMYLAYDLSFVDTTSERPLHQTKTSLQAETGRSQDKATYIVPS